MSWSVYLVRCRDGSLYTGVASDVARRFAEHGARAHRRGAKYLAGRGPLSLVYQLEVGTRGRALRVERRIKGWRKAQKELLVAGDEPVAATLKELLEPS
jgi:putative endonuclease